MPAVAAHRLVAIDGHGADEALVTDLIRSVPIP